MIILEVLDPLVSVRRATHVFTIHVFSILHFLLSYIVIVVVHPKFGPKDAHIFSVKSSILMSGHSAI